MPKVEKNATLSAEEAIRYIHTYFNETIKDSHGRYMSWRHCYNAFMVNRNPADEGTLGCVPAYDRYYVQAVRQYGISAGGYSRGSVRDVARYYLSHKDEFECIREELSTCGTEYPVMKLMDMCMWQAAFEADTE